jgi:hypothetical protein
MIITGKSSIGTGFSPFNKEKIKTGFSQNTELVEVSLKL